MRNIFVLLVCVCVAAGCLYAEGVGSGEPSGGADDDTSGCEDNQPPQLLGLYYFLKEGESWVQLEMPVSIAPSDFDKFYIRLEYADEDCNLEGGKFWLKFEGGNWQEVEELPDDIGCSTEQTGYLYPLKLKDAVGELTSGNYSGGVKWSDVCEDESNTLEFEFTLL